MPPINLFDEYDQKITRAINQYKLTLDRVGYDLSWGWGPNPNQGGFMACYWLVLVTPNPGALGQTLMHVVALETKFPTDADVNRAVQSGLVELRTACAKALEVNGQPGQ
jgi:hypothetical protein